MGDNLVEEANAFNKRINERVAAGFVPDLKNGVPCTYFYKSMFRHPHFMNLYFKRAIDFYSSTIDKQFSKRKVRILDVGCGPGIVTLELARLGHDVHGIDIASDAVKSANETANKYFDKSNGGNLSYGVTPFMEIEGKFDVLLFSGVLHHLDDLGACVNKINNLLNDNGLVLCQEPYHNLFNENDASLVALFRTMLSITGNWYEEDLQQINSHDKFGALSSDILTEYRLERDKHEVGGQSPNDLSHDGHEILEGLKSSFNEIQIQPFFSFIYRFLGGLRGDDETVKKLADLLVLFDTYATSNKLMNPNYFLFAGAKK